MEKLPEILIKRRPLHKVVLENLLVGTLMGALIGIALKGYLGHLKNLDMEWTLFMLMGLMIGLFSGFARQRQLELKKYQKKVGQRLNRSDRQLIRTERRYKNLLDQANDVIFILDAEGCFVEMNGKFEEILGYSRDNWVGRSFYDLIPDNFQDEAIKYYWETLKGGTPRFNLDAIRSDGKVVNLALANSPVRNPDGDITGVMGIARDISERKKIQELQNKFVSHVSHELRTPLAAMREFISLLIDEIPGDLNGEQKKYCERVRSNIDRLSRIIENLLLLSRVDASKITLNKNLIDLNKLVSQVRDDMILAAGAKSQKIQLELSPGIPRIYADPDKIIQVLTNLVGNAIKFTEKGGWIKIGIEEKDEEIIIKVADNGIGIPANLQAKIFDRFQQIREGHKFGRKGSGLGLAISREIISLHRGRIWLKSSPEEGSTFYFSLPKSRAPKIMLVDDDPDLVEMFKDFLEPCHYRVITAYNGEEAIKRAVKEIPDLIILDIVMPRMNGYEVIGWLKGNKETCNIPIIILTGYGLDKYRLDKFGSKVIPALHKPVSMEEFLATVNSVVGTE